MCAYQLHVIACCHTKGWSELVRLLCTVIQPSCCDVNPGAPEASSSRVGSSNNWSGLFYDNNFLYTFGSACLLVRITFKPFECGGHKAKITYHRKQEIVFSLGQGANEILASTQRKIQLQI